MELDYAAVLNAAPSPLVVLSTDLVVIAANEAYLAVTERSREQLVGARLLEQFPDNDTDPTGAGQAAVQASLRHVLATGRQNTLPVQRYDLRDPATGAWSVRYWSMTTVPVLDVGGQVAALLHRQEEVTALISPDLDRQQRTRRRGDQVLEQARQLAAGRAVEISAAWAAEATVNRRLAGLAAVAVELALADTVAELITLITERGLSALGAMGGAVAILDDQGVLRSTLTGALGDDTALAYAEMPLDGALPSSRAAATGRPVLLPDLAASLSQSPEMAQVLSMTGCQAWASLPLRAGDQVLGALTVGWADAHPLPPTEVEILEAFAAQCVQGLQRLRSREQERRAGEAVAAMAEALQRSLLSEPASSRRLQVAARYRPAAEQAQIGGDWHDAFPATEGATWAVIGDIAGHDRHAAAAMGQARNLLRGVAYAHPATPAAVLSILDHAMRDLDVDVLATAVLARLEPMAGSDDVGPAGQYRLCWSNAGHLPPLLVVPGEMPQLLSAEPDLLLGLEPETNRRGHSALMPPGALLLLYTDGLVERRGASLDHGLDWLVATVAALGTADPDLLCDVLLDAVVADAQDDIALLAVRVRD